MKPSMADLVTIATCTTTIEAHLIKMRLEQAGVSCHLANEHLLNLAGFPGGATTVWVQVSRDDAEQGRHILAQEPEALEAVDDDHAFADEAWGAVHCPRCASLDIHFEEPPRGFGTFLPPALHGVCDVCGHRWRLE